MAEFLQYIQQQVAEYSSRWSLSTGKAFMLWYAIEGLDMDESSALTAVSYDGGNDKDIDLFHVDDLHSRVVIAQGKYNHNGSYKSKKGELLSLYHTTDWLRDSEALHREGRDDLASVADEFQQAITRGYRVDFHYVYMGPPKRDVTDQANLLNSAEADDAIQRHVSVLPLAALEEIHREAIGDDTRIDRDSLGLARGRYFSQNGNYGTALVATINGAEISRLHEKYGDKLFARNVRLFLGVRAGGVNARIHETLESAADRPNFWAYNNGLTIICDSFKVVRGPQVILTNFSMVNGCQTTVSLSNVSADVGSADVLIKVIAAPERIVDNIIFNTNSQTPIREWELHSQDRVQKHLQEELAKNPNPWYYALRRGESRVLSSADRARFSDDGQLRSIHYDELAQYLAAFRGLPYIAYKDKGRIFSEFYNLVFPQTTSAELVILVWRAGLAAKQEVSTALKSGNGEDELSSLILKRGGVLFTISVIAMLLAKRNGATYVDRLKREVVTSKNTAEKLGIYARVALVLYRRATRAMVGDGGVTGLASVLRTQDSFPRLRRAIDEEWELRSIDKSWVEALPKI